MSLPIRMKILAALLCISTAVSAFKVPTHVATANAAMDDMISTLRASTPTNNVIFHGVTLAVTNKAAYNAILDNPDAFRAGVVGPDAFPDMVSGQMYLHTNNGEFATPPVIAKTHWEPRKSENYRSIDYGMALLKEVVSKSTVDNKALAFVLGYIGHCIGDGFAHTYVNEMAGGSWDYVKGAGLFGPATEEIKHMAVEGFMDFHVPDRLRNQAGATNFNRMNLSAPYDLLDKYYNTVSTEPCPGCDILERVTGGFQKFNGGRIYNYFQAQIDVVSFLRKNAGGNMARLMELVGAPNSTNGAKTMLVSGGMAAGKAAFVAPVLADYIQNNAKLILPKSYLNEISNNLDAVVTQMRAYRRNWLVMSKCVQQNVVKGHAVGNADNCTEVQGDLLYQTPDGKYTMTAAQRTLFEARMKKLFEPMKDATGALEDHHKVFVNVKRQAKYLEDSFLLDELDGVVIPADVRLYFQKLKEFLKSSVAVDALEGLLSVAATAVNEAVCVANAGACGFECQTGNRCAGGLAACEARRHDACVSSARTCVNYYFGKSCFTDWAVQYPICMAGNTTYCTATSTYDCAKCNAGCIQEAGKCAVKAITSVDLVAELQAIADWVQAKIDEVKQQIVDYIATRACDLARMQGAPVDNLYRLVAIYKSLEDKNANPNTVMNLVFLKDDLNPATQEGKNWYNALMAQGISAQAKSLITSVRNGEVKEFFGDRLNDAGAFPIAVPANCLTFDKAGAFDRDPVFAELRTLKFFSDNPGPTAARVKMDIGEDMAADFGPFFNAAQGLKLLGVNNQTDIKGLFSQVGASQANLPWNVNSDYKQCEANGFTACATAKATCEANCPTDPFGKRFCVALCEKKDFGCWETARTTCSEKSGMYSDICVDAKTINVFCDAIPSLDDPNCIDCTNKPLVKPYTNAMLEKNLEIETTPQKWTRRRSLVPWEQPTSGIPDALSFVNTHFMLATSPETIDKVYKKIFVMPGEGIRRWRTKILSPISPLIVEEP